MMVLQDLFYGNINPNEQCFDKDSEYAKYVGIVSDNEEKLTTFLNSLPNTENERHLLSQMINARSELSQFSEIERFIEGFRLGAGIMLDTFILPQQSVIRDIS